MKEGETEQRRSERYREGKNRRVRDGGMKTTEELVIVIERLSKSQMEQTDE